MPFPYNFSKAINVAVNAFNTVRRAFTPAPVVNRPAPGKAASGSPASFNKPPTGRPPIGGGSGRVLPGSRPITGGNRQPVGGTSPASSGASGGITAVGGGSSAARRGSKPASSLNTVGARANQQEGAYRNEIGKPNRFYSSPADDTFAKPLNYDIEDPVLIEGSIKDSVRGFLDFVLGVNWDEEVQESVLDPLNKMLSLVGGHPLFITDLDEPDRLPAATVRWLHGGWGNLGVDSFSLGDPVEMAVALKASVQRDFEQYLPDFDLSGWENASAEQLLDLYIFQSRVLASERERMFAELEEMGFNPDLYRGLEQDASGNYIPLLGAGGEFSGTYLPFRTPEQIEASLEPYENLLNSFDLEIRTPLTDLFLLEQEFGGLNQTGRQYLIERLLELNEEQYMYLMRPSADEISTLQVARMYRDELYSRVPKNDEGEYFGPTFDHAVMVMDLERLEGTFTLPDYTLVVVAAQILLEPIDWVVTGIEVIGDLLEGDYESAAINTGLAILPVAGGWMDDVTSRAIHTSDNHPTTIVDDILTFRTSSDPFRDVLGPALGNPQYQAEVDAMIRDMEASGVQVTIDSRTGMFYSPRASVDPMNPGSSPTLRIDQNASIYAWRHEYQHFLDDKAAGFRTLATYFTNPDLSYSWELRGYMIEIEAARRMNLPAVENEIIESLLDRKNALYQGINTFTRDDILRDIENFGG